MIDWLLHLAQTYPELIAISAGLIIPIAVTQMLYMFWYPVGWTQRECFQVTSVIDLLVCYCFTSALWHLLDPADHHKLIVVASIGISLCAPLVHSVGLRFIMHRYPWLESKSIANDSSVQYK